MASLRYSSLLAIVIALAALTAPPAASADPLNPLQQMYILKEIKPDMERVGILWSETAPNHDALMRKVQQAAAASGVKVFVAYVDDMRDVAPSYRTLRRDHDIDVLWILDDDGAVGSSVGRNYLIKNATQHGVPLLAPTADWVNDGAPISLQRIDGAITVMLNEAAAAATALTVPDKYATQSLTAR